MRGGVGQRIADMQRLERRQAESADVVVRFGSVQLHEIEWHARGDGADRLRIVIAKDADELRPIRPESFRDPRHVLRIAITRRFFDEDESEKIGAERGGMLRVFQSREPAYFDLHDSSPSPRSRRAAPAARRARGGGGGGRGGPALPPRSVLARLRRDRSAAATTRRRET